MAPFFPALAQAFQAVSRAPTSLPKYAHTPGNDDTTEQTGILKDLEVLGLEDYKTLSDFANVSITGEVDDNDLILERIVTLLAKLPPHSKTAKSLTDGFVNTLWDALEHPPSRTLGRDTSYREADGSNNNIRAPSMGAGNTPYARTVSAMVFQNPDLPDPEHIFDSLMTRGDGSSFREHPNKISSMMFYLAIIITHDCFQTDSKDRNINLASSYLDLSPLYGRNIEEQKAIRTFKDGMLKADCFSSKAALGFPPGVGVFLIMFNRFHNYVVTQLALINEGGRFTKPDSTHSSNYSEARMKYDNDLFQTGRLITCGLYINIVLKDYVRTILNLNRSGSTWDLDPRTHEKKNAMNSRPAPEATGNQVSVEFNLVYRWHSAISKRDDKWTTDLLRQKLGGLDPAKASVKEVMAALGRFEHTVPRNPEDREFACLQRDEDGTYSDDELVEILSSSIEDVAGAFGANQVPSALRVVEVLGMRQARAWHVATLNEFRQHFGLKKHDTFEDINPDPAVSNKLTALYDSPDAVELYPGLVAEKPKPPMSGSGLCVGYTTSQAILSDAVALVRGDRFYTVDYTPRNLTNWGYNEANFDLGVDQGQVMHKLIFRAFPNHFANNSIYAHFPFVVPQENEIIHKALGTSDTYSWARPARKIDPIVIRPHKAFDEVINNNAVFRASWSEGISQIVCQPQKTGLSGRGPANQQNHNYVNECLYQPKEWEAEIKHYFKLTTGNLLEKAGRSLPPSPLSAVGSPGALEVDIVRDIIIPANTRFMADLFALPIKTSETSPHGVYTEQELYDLLTAMFTAVGFDYDPANTFKLRTKTRQLASELANTMKLETEASARAGWLTNVAVRFGLGGNRQAGGPKTNDGLEWPCLPSYGRQLLARMMEKEKSAEECVVGAVMPISAASTTTMSAVLSQCLDYFLGAGSEYIPELYKLAHADCEEADDKLLLYMLEGIRLSGSWPGVCYIPSNNLTQSRDDTVPCISNPSDPTGTCSDQTYTGPPTQRATIDLATASHDPEAFPTPEALRLDRPLSSYISWEMGSHECLGEGITRAALAAAFKTIVSLPGLTRAPGPRGDCKSVEFKEWRGQSGRKAVRGGGEEWTGRRVYLTPDQSAYSPVPTTMRVRWDGHEESGAEGSGFEEADWFDVEREG
ncbi:linoleate diol synthase precursor [Xylariales sp. AK1849]|nr:linoleate diol synthase precursor [Xylariales sp. AK1849]